MPIRELESWLLRRERAQRSSLEGRSECTLHRAGVERATYPRLVSGLSQISISREPVRNLADWFHCGHTGQGQASARAKASVKNITLQHCSTDAWGIQIFRAYSTFGRTVCAPSIWSREHLQLNCDLATLYPALQADLGVVATHVDFLLLGLYAWEYLGSWDVEYALIRSRMAFRWFLVPYLVGRIVLLLSLVVNTIEPSSWSGTLSCSFGVRLIALTGVISVACASTNLMIRTWAIWKRSLPVHALLVSISIGHWVVLAMEAANVKPSTGNGFCDVIIINPDMSTIFYIYTVCYDLTVFVLSAIGLSKQLSKSPLYKQLLIQGLSYFAVVFISYVPATVFSLIDVPGLAQVMMSITGKSAACASMIASCKAVKALLHLPQPHSNARTPEIDEVAFTTHIEVPASSSASSDHPSTAV